MSSSSTGKVGDLLTLQRGFDITKKEQTAGIYPVVSSSGITSYHNKFMASGPSVVIGRKGTLGSAFYIETDCWPHDTTLWVKDFKGSDPKFIYYFLKTLRLERLDSGSSNPTLNRNFVHQLDANKPEPNAQKKIAAVLSALDARIECNNRINAKLEAMAKTLFDYWFVQFDFPDADGKPYKSSGGKMEYNVTLKREVPVGWADMQLSKIANITMGQSPAGESLNAGEKGMEFFQGSTDFGWRFPTVRQYTTQPARMAKRNDILLSVRAPVGDLNVAHIDCCIGRGLAALNSKDGFDGFLFYVMQYFKTVFDRRNSEGTTFGSITKDDLHSLPLAYPTTELLRKYDKVVSGYNQMVFARSMENQQLTQLRDWLLPMLMNGQVTVA